MKTCEALAVLAGRKILVELGKENRKFVTKTWEELNRLVEGAGNRERRAIKDWFMGGGIGMSLVTAGYDMWTTHKLKKHVEEVETEFEAFRRNQTRFDREQIHFNKKILTVMKETDSRLVRQECQADGEVMDLLNQRRLLEWKSYMLQLYQGVLSGSRVGGISPMIFPKHYMKKIIAEDSSLNRTTYQKNEELAYRLGVLTVVGSKREENQFSVHVVVSFPDTGTSEIRPVYRILQTGVVLNGTQCGRFELPTRVYEEQGQYYEMENAICETRANLHLCWGGSGSGKREVPCLSSEDECKITLEKCSTQIRETRAGLQVRTKEEIRAATKQDPTVWKTIDLGESRTKFFNRSLYRGIMVGDYLRDMKDENYKLDIETIPNPDRWREIIKAQWETHQAENITELSSIVKEQQHIVQTMKKEQKKRAWERYVLFTAL